MNLNKAAKRYAKALLTFAIERDELEVIRKDIQNLQGVLDASRELKAVMSSAVIQEEQKIAIYQKAFDGKISAVTLNFMILIAKNSRSSIIPHILIAFEQQYKAIQNIVTVNITTATKMNDELKASLIAYLQQLSPESTIDIQEEIDPELIGGFIFRTDTHQIDASVANRLKSLQRDLHNTTYISKL